LRSWLLTSRGPLLQATDQIFQFLFDEKTGHLTANTPPVLQLKQGTGPRHLVMSQHNRFIYLLNELTGRLR